MARSLSVQPANIQFIQNYVTVLCQLGQFETAIRLGAPPQRLAAASS